MDSGGALQSWYAVRTPGSRLLVYLVAATTVTASGAVAEIPAAGRESRSWRDELRTRFESGQAQTGLTIDYPLDETLFPPEIAAPTFRWTDAASGANTWLVTVEVADGMPGVQGIAQSPEWTPREDDWESLKRRSVAGEARLTVLGFARDDRSALLSGAQVRFGTSRDEVGAPLFYREVNLPFSDAVKDPTTIRWRFGSVASMEPPPIVLEGLPVCGNCHSFSTDGRLLGMDVDYANDKGSYALTRVSEEIVLGNQDIITWSDFRRDERNPTFGLLSQVSPDGAYVVSTVKDRSVFVAQPDLAFSQLFFPIRGILAIYQRESGTFAPLPGADDPTFVQSNPTWSPDGETIVFARAKAHRLARDEGKVLLTRQECEEFLEGGQTFQYDLYSIPFNDGAGGTPQPLAGASANGMSNYFPKYSPDGKWIVFCRSKSFMLLQPDSELYIVPAGGGQARRLRCNTARMNSWHSWSPNGKWLVFASKANSPYTQLCLTHIDEQGRSTPPVVLSRLVSPDRAANIPEFVNAGPTAIRSIREAFIDDLSYVRAGDAFQRAGDVDGAMREYRRALAFNAENAVAHNNLGGLLATQGLIQAAETHLLRAIGLEPQNASAHYNLGMLEFRRGQLEPAVTRLSAAVRIDPDLAAAHSTLGSLLCARGQLEEGELHLGEAIRLNPDDGAAHCGLGEALARRGRIAEAVQHLGQAVKLDPRDATARYSLGKALALQGNVEKAAAHLESAVQIEPDYAPAHVALGKLRSQQGRTDDGLRHLSLAVRLRPNDPAMLTEVSLLFATAEDPGLRNEHQAIDIAKRACDLTGRRVPQPLRALATAHAAAGQFDEAARAAEQALTLARQAGQTDLARQIEQQIAIYRQSR